MAFLGSPQMAIRLTQALPTGALGFFADRKDFLPLTNNFVKPKKIICQALLIMDFTLDFFDYHGPSPDPKMILGPKLRVHYWKQRVEFLWKITN